MRKKRIDGALASIPVQNGQVLKGEHLAILREVLSAAINENKYDIDRIISAEPDAIHVYGDNVEALNDYVSTNEVEDKTFGFLYTSYGVEMYKYNEGADSWEFQTSLSLVELSKRIQLLEQDLINQDFPDYVKKSASLQTILSDLVLKGSILIPNDLTIGEDLYVNGSIRTEYEVLSISADAVNFGGSPIKNISHPEDETDAATKEYVDGLINQPRRLTSPDGTVWELQESINNEGVVTSTWVPVE